MEMITVEIYCAMLICVQPAQTQKVLWQVWWFAHMKETKFVLTATASLAVSLFLSALKRNVLVLSDTRVYILFLDLHCVKELSKHWDETTA